MISPRTPVGLCVPVLRASAARKGGRLWARAALLPLLNYYLMLLVKRPIRVSSRQTCAGWVEKETKNGEMHTNVAGLKVPSVQTGRTVDDVRSSLSGLSERNLAVTHTTLACYYTPPLPSCPCADHRIPENHTSSTKNQRFTLDL